MRALSERESGLAQVFSGREVRSVIAGPCAAAVADRGVVTSEDVHHPRVVHLYHRTRDPQWARLRA